MEIITDSILLLSPAIATSNLGDEIIMECVEKELEPIIGNSFIYRLPTHVSSFHWYQVLRNSQALCTYSQCRYKFVGGSNLLVKNMLTHYPQWNMNLFNCKPFSGSILVGVGAGAGDKTNFYTRRLYRRVLNHELIHSVRDERSKEFVESLGLKAINTGCATMWRLTPEFCRTIPSSKASRVVFTLTSYSPDPVQDQALVDILKRNYEKVLFWVQDSYDLAYLAQLKGTSDIEVIKPSKEEYDRLLSQEDIDYVGTRLHAGIYAMRHRKRSVIIVIDERAREINRSNNLVCIERSEVADSMERLIQSTFNTEIRMPLEDIERWKTQFVP